MEQVSGTQGHAGVHGCRESATVQRREECQ